MSIPRERVIEPSDNDILDAFKKEIFRDLRVCMPGEIQSFDVATASATVKIKIKEILDVEAGQSIAYPVLADVPVYVQQGGGAFVELPIAAGDPCLVFFCDRDIDTWWTSGNETTPNTLRKHNLSDSFAVVGVNPKSAALPLTGNFRLFGAGHKVDVANDAQALSTLTGTLFTHLDTLFSDLDDLITSIKAIVTVGTAATQALNPASIAALTVNATALSALKTNVDTLKTDFTQLLGED